MYYLLVLLFISIGMRFWYGSIDDSGNIIGIIQQLFLLTVLNQLSISIFLLF